MQGRAGRRPKWRYVDVEPEVAVAMDVERERRAQCITKSRTPDWLYAKIAKRHRVSARSARRFYAKHADWARELLSIPEFLARRRRQLAELMEVYGDEIGRLGLRAIDRLSRERNALRPSEIRAFDERVRSIIGQKGEKSAR
ncbi:MAG TPA: hypothetical protein VLD36_10910 [Burkholderiales bacterium]|nr:hypothetical protein [Burkholderiales bacterium]